MTASDPDLSSTAPEGNLFSPEELAELAGQLRRMWHAIVRGVHQPGHPEPAQGQQYWVLGSLIDGSRRMSDLAQCAQTSQASLTGIVDRLEERGLVERVRSQEDRRVVDVTLTADGREEMRRVEAKLLGSLDLALTPLSTKERRELLALIRLIADNQPADADHTC